MEQVCRQALVEIDKDLARLRARVQSLISTVNHSDAWFFPVGTVEHPPADWYCAQYHTPGIHTGLDLNLDKAPWGDVDRGMPVYAITAGYVFFTTPDWSGVPMCVIEHSHEGRALYVRYAHIELQVATGQAVDAGQQIGVIANWKTGDHLHFDMATNEFTREWLSAHVEWIDPVPVLKAHLPPAKVDALLRKGS